VLDHANGMATFAAGGERAQAHFVREVSHHGSLVYAEPLVQTNIGLRHDQVDALTGVLRQVPAARLADGWQAAGKTGTWEAGPGSPANAHAWMVGYTDRLAVAVWLGTTDGAALITSAGTIDVFGSTHAAPIWRQFIIDATAAMAPAPAVPPTPAATMTA